MVNTPRYCGVCGKLRRAETAYCEACGTKFGPDALEGAASTAETQREPTPDHRATALVPTPPEGTSAASTSGAIAGLPPARWILGGAIAMGIALPLPWITLFSFSFSALSAVGRDGYWLLLVGATLAALGLAVAVVSNDERAQSRALWTWVAVTFGATTALSALFLVAFAGAGSQSGLGGLASRAAGIGIGYFVHAAGSVIGLVLSIRTRQLLGDRTEGATGAVVVSRESARSIDAESGDGIGRPLPASTAFSEPRPGAGSADPAPAQHKPIGASTKGESAPKSSLPKGLAIAGVGVLLVVAFILVQGDPKRDALRLADTACAEATAWRTHTDAGNAAQMSVDQSALNNTLQELSKTIEKLSVSSRTQSEFGGLMSIVQIGFLGPYTAPSSCESFRSSLRQDLGANASSPAP